MVKNNKGSGLEQQANLLEGDIIKEIFKNADAIAFLHQTISSPRGNYFRRRLLQLLAVETSISEIENMRAEAQLRELQRHINKLSELQLISSCKEDTYKRTEKGEKAVNALRALETESGKEEARKVFTSVLGTNSIRFFLRVYSSKRKADLKKKEIKFSPAEIGKLSLFLPRTIEGIAAIDKLSDAELLVYKDDGNIYLDPKKARGFYKYLKLLYQV
jgi:uncharacterized protein YbcI